MTKTNTKTAAPTAPKAGSKRALALASISTLAFAEDTARAASIANMCNWLGTSPSEVDVKTGKRKWVIGRVANRLKATDLPRGKTSPADRLAFAEELVERRASPPKPGVKSRGLRKGQTGYRTPSQHKVVRAAEEACSVFFAELGLSNATPTAQRDAAKRAAQSSKVASKDAPKPAHAELVKPAAPVSSVDYVQHMQTQLAALVAYDDKHASKRPTTHGEYAEQLRALKQTANKAANDFEVRQAKAIADAAAKSK